jgi:uncharacterized protein YcgI (DUF1989 family)
MRDDDVPHDDVQVGVVHRIGPASGVAFRIARGRTLRVVSPTGLQVADLFSVLVADPAEGLSSGRSIDYADKLWLTTGDVLYSNRSRAMWTIGRDDVGRHDLTLTPCSPEMFVKLRGDDGTHPSCYENLRRPLARFGVAAATITCSFNIFMDVGFHPTTGKMSIGPPASKPGDVIELFAEEDMLVGLTACSSENTNAGTLKPIDVAIE